MALVVNKGKVERMARECISPKSGKGGSHVCVFCFNGADEEKYGKMFTKAGVTVHYFCMLFSSGLCQNGKSEKEGILGFIQRDILKEVKRGYRLRCKYCRKVGATIGCVVRNCKKMFHLGCGRSNGTMHQFFGTFCSYCPDHRVQQDIPSDDDPNIVCSICMNTVKAAPSDTTLRAPCCKNYWYHRDCVQAYAMSAGLHFFKCPLCNNKDEFQDEMLTMGIYIPDQDASWEKEPNAFQELLERYGQCDAPNCRCDKGRTFSKDESKWEIILCDFCGSHGSHKACKHLIKHGKNKICQDCKEVDDKNKEGHNNGTEKNSSKRKSLDALQLKLNSPNSSKASSTYPGPSSAMKKEGLPQLDGRKNKSCSKNLSKRMMEDTASEPVTKKLRRPKTATVSYQEFSFDEDSDDSVKLCPPLPAQSVGKVGRMKKKAKSTEWIGSSQSILRDWLQSKNAKSATTSTRQRVPTLKASPRKKKPMVVKWEGKELLIKSPRVVLHRKRIYSRRNLNPRNLTIDMSDGKLGSDWNKEMELLTQIDTEKRVTRNMIDIDAAKSVFDQTKVTNRKLILNDVSPKKQYVSLFPDLQQTCSSSSSRLPCEALNSLDKDKPKLKHGTPSQNSSMKEMRKILEIMAFPQKGRHKRKYTKHNGAKYHKKTTIVGTQGHPGPHADIAEVIDAEGKILLKKKTLPLDNSDDKTTAYSKDTATSSPVSSKFGDMLKLSLKSPYVRNCNTNPTSLVLINDDEDKSSYGEITPKAARNQMKKSVNSKSEDLSPIWPINTKKPNCIDGFLWQYDESPIFPSKITRDILSTKFLNSSHEKTPKSIMNSVHKKSPGSSTKHQIIPIVIEDSPANNLRCRKLAYTDSENRCYGDNANDADKYEKSDFTSTCPTLIDRLRNYSFQLDQYNPALKTNFDGRLNTRPDGTQLSSHKALGSDSENSNGDIPASSMEKRLDSVEKVFKQNNESGIYLHLDGTRQIGENSPKRNSENKYKKIRPSTPQSDHERPVSARSSPRKSAVLTPPRRSTPRKTEASDAEVVDTLSDLQNTIPSYDIEIDSPEDLCDTAKNLSPSYFTKFRNALSRSESLDSITKNTLGKGLSVMMQGAESPVIAVPCKSFPQSRQNILSTINEHSSNYVKLRSSPRSSPRRCHEGGSNKQTEHANDRAILSECSPRRCHKKSSDKADDNATDKSIMSEYYNYMELLDEADSDIRLLPLGQFTS